MQAEVIMKRFIPMVVLVFLLASCAPASTPTVLPSTLTATAIPTPTPEPTKIPTPQPTDTPTLVPTPQIGVGQSYVLWKWLSDTPPANVQAYFDSLKPTPVDFWNQPTGLKLDTGQDILWGKAVGYVDKGNRIDPIVPGLVMDLVYIDDYGGKPEYAVVIAFPVKGGVVYWTGVLIEDASTNSTLTVIHVPKGYPSACSGDVPCARSVYDEATHDLDMMSQKQLIQFMQGQLKGKVALFELDGLYETTVSSDIARGVGTPNMSFKHTGGVPTILVETP
jgi:hypothetical protein